VLIEFKNQLDGSAQATVASPQANAVQNSPEHKLLGPAYVAAPAAAKARAGGDVPLIGPPGGDGPLIGPPGGNPPLIGPPGGGAPSGSGSVFVIGPIVVCGSGPVHTGAGGDAPLIGPGTGPPKSAAPESAQNDTTDADANRRLTATKRARKRV
jgi:hypothetical protein